MKKLSLLILSLLVIGSFVFAQSITVTSPNGGQNWDLGTSHNVTWTSSGVTGDVGIKLFQNGVSLGYVAENIPVSNGTYSWTISNIIGVGPISAGSNYQIQVKQTGVAGDLSDSNFVISPGSTPAASITVTSPNGGENWDLGSSHNVTWTSSGITGDVGIKLFQNGSSLGYIAENVPNTGTYSWTISNIISVGPISAGSNYQIQVKSGVTGDQSNGNFTLKQVFSTMINPVLKATVILPKPDLAINGKITRTPKHPGMGESFRIQFQIINNGKGKAVASNAELIIKGPEFNKVEEFSMAEFPSQGSFINYAFDYKLDNWGIYRFTLKLDVDNNITESDENNNEKFILVGINPLPDLKITNVNTPDYKKTIQQKCIMNVTVTNVGQADSGKFEIDCDMDTCKGIAQGRKYKVHEGLKPGKSVTFRFTHRYFCFKMVGVDFHVDKNNQVKEANEHNNECGLPFHISGDNIGKKKSPWSSNCN